MKLKKIKITSNRVLALGFIGILAFFGLHNSDKLFSAFATPSKSLQSFATSLEKSYSEEFYKKYYFLNANGLISRLMGQEFMNDVVKLNNGYLSMTNKKEDMSKNAQNLIALNGFLKEKEIPLLFVQAPYKISKYDTQLPPGIEDYANENADDLLKLLAASGVDTLDLREEIVKDGIDHYSLFFKTDHHWTPESGFWAFGKIVSLLNKKYGYTINEMYTDVNNYSVEVYRDWFLGSAGKRVGTCFAGVDDISLITPKFDTLMKLTVPARNIVREGSFADAIFSMDHISKKNYFETSSYSVYIGGDYPLVIHENALPQSDKKILIVKDSFVLPVQAFLSTIFKEVDVVDLRHYEDGTLTEYIEESDPDMVLFLYNPKALSINKMFRFD